MATTHPFSEHCEGSKQQLSTLSSKFSPKPKHHYNHLIYLKWSVPHVPVQQIRIHRCHPVEEEEDAAAAPAEDVDQTATTTEDHREACPERTWPN